MGSRLAAVLWSSLNSSLVCSVVSILKGGIETSKCLLIRSYLSGVAFLIPEQLLGAYVVVRDWPFCYYKMPSMTFLLFEGPLACRVLNPGPRAWDTLPPSYLPALFSRFLSRLGSLCCSGLDSPFASASHRAESLAYPAAVPAASSLLAQPPWVAVLGLRRAASRWQGQGHPGLKTKQKPKTSKQKPPWGQ